MGACSQQLRDVGPSVARHEEKSARTVAPQRKQISVTDEYPRSIRIVRTPQHRTDPSIDQQGLPLGIEEKRRTVRYIAIEDQRGTRATRGKCG